MCDSVIERGQEWAIITSLSRSDKNSFGDSTVVGHRERSRGKTKELKLLLKISLEKVRDGICLIVFVKILRKE